MSCTRWLAVMLAALAQACVIAWSADWIYAAHGQTAAALSGEGVFVWLIGLVVFGMGWMPLIGAALLAASVAYLVGRTLDPDNTQSTCLPCFALIALLALAGWKFGLAYWPPSALGAYDSRGALSQMLLGLSALLYLPFTAYAVWIASASYSTIRPSTSL